MSVMVLIPTPLRRYLGGVDRVDVAAANVEEALEALAQRHPELKRQLFDEQGKLRNFVKVHRGDQDLRDQLRDGASVPLQDGDTLTIIPAIAGGAPAPAAARAEGRELSREEILRYSRHLIMPEVTMEGQKRLKAARVLCVGVGGLGSPMALYLAAAGVGRIGLVDFDVVDLTNIQRQVLYSSADVGRPKLEAARERLLALNPEIEVISHPVRLDRENVMGLFADYDVIADGTDNFPTRYLVNDACVLSRRPNVYASIFRFEGQISVFDTRRGPCYRCLFPEPPPPGLVPSCAEGGVLGVLPGIVGSLQALEVLKLILDRGEPLIGRLVLFDALAFRFREVQVPRDPRCPVCGQSPTIQAPIDDEAFCGIRGEDAEIIAPEGVAVLSVEEFQRKRSEGERLHLIDVRERHEYEIVHIEGAQLIPLGELPARLHELDSAQTYVVHCHHSVRSLQALELMRHAGFHRLFLLDGGVDAWAERIDPDLPRY